MDSTGHNFHDEDLRQALRRAFPAEQAPADLRKRMTALLRNPEMCDADMHVPEPVRLTPPAGSMASSELVQEGDPLPMPRAWFGNLFHGARRVALAASFAGLAMGVALFVAMQNGNPAPSEPGGQYADSPAVSPFVQAAVVRHDELLQPSNPARAVSSSLRPLPQIRTEVQQHLRVPEADFSSQGWQLVGGKAWKSDGSTVAQICYRRSEQTLSVFIAPRTVDGRRTQMSTAHLQDHIVATRETPTGNLCVVGHAPDNGLSTQEVSRLADLLAAQ